MPQGLSGTSLLGSRACGARLSGSVGVRGLSRSGPKGAGRGHDDAEINLQAGRRPYEPRPGAAGRAARVRRTGGRADRRRRLRRRLGGVRGRGARGRDLRACAAWLRREPGCSALTFRAEHGGGGGARGTCALHDRFAPGFSEGPAAGAAYLRKTVAGRDACAAPGLRGRARGGLGRGAHARARRAARAVAAARLPRAAVAPARRADAGGSRAALARSPAARAAPPRPRAPAAARHRRAVTPSAADGGPRRTAGEGGAIARRYRTRPRKGLVAGCERHRRDHIGRERAMRARAAPSPPSFPARRACRRGRSFWAPRACRRDRSAWSA